MMGNYDPSKNHGYNMMPPPQHQQLQQHHHMIHHQQQQQHLSQGKAQNSKNLPKLAMKICNAN
jgi:hypothetical protein